MRFGAGEKPRIAVFNKATAPLDLELRDFVVALQHYVARALRPVWGTPAHLVVSRDFVDGAWALVFLDDADQAGALAYHGLTPDGLPSASVFVRTIQRYRASLTIAASHELAEMLVDPAVNLMCTGPDPEATYAYEVCDPCEAEPLAMLIKGIKTRYFMSDFVFPSYFEEFRAPRSTRFDWSDAISRPFELSPGGYQIVFKGGEWTNVFGSTDKAAEFSLEDRRGHRSERRKRA